MDDKPNNNVWERRALESYGVSFELALDTDQAKQMLAKPGAFAAVISDLGRPGDRNAGFTLLKWLREAPERAEPYFIYSSARAAQSWPATDGPKPQGVTADPDALVAMIMAALR